MLTEFSIDRSFAHELDKSDKLSRFRKRFYIPPGTVYLDGNSLGLLSKDAESSLLRVIDEWKNLAIFGWLDGKQPWFTMGEDIGKEAASLVGAEPEEVVFTGTTTINIHSLISTFYQPKGKRKKILADILNFPSDLYALQGQIRLKGGEPQTDLVLVPSKDGITLHENDILELMTDEVAIAWLPSVLYCSGQLLDMELLTAEAHKRGIIIGFDCCHSAGAVPHHFDKWGVDFGVFCSYKYLNGGPGSTAFLYLNRKHFGKEPQLPGWFGFIKSRMFGMEPLFEHAESAGGWQISAPGILGSATLEGSLKIIHEAGIDNIREKSLRLTDYLIFLIREKLLPLSSEFAIATPADQKSRGGHVSLIHKTESFRINEALKARKIIPDLRPPNMIRIAPAALYNTFAEVWQLVEALKVIMEKKEYLNFSNERKAIT
ncbi:MAG: kynureninase [Bacteroidota bacterium]